VVGAGAGAAWAAKSRCSVEKGGRRDLETLLAVDAEVPGRGSAAAAAAAAGVDWLRRCVLTAGAGIFLGAIEDADVGGEPAVVSVCIDTGRRDDPVAVVDVTVPLLSSLLGKVLDVDAAVAGFLSVAAAVPVEVLVLVPVVLVLKLRFGTSSFFSFPAVAVAAVLVELLKLIPPLAAVGTTFFAAAAAAPRFSFSFSSSLLPLSFKFLAPTVRRIAVLSFASFLSGAGGGGMRVLSAGAVSDVGVTSRLILDLDGEGSAAVELSAADGVVRDGVGIALLGICRDEAADGGVEGVEGTGSGIVGCGSLVGGWVVVGGRDRFRYSLRATTTLSCEMREEEQRALQLQLFKKRMTQQRSPSTTPPLNSSVFSLGRYFCGGDPVSVNRPMDSVASGVVLNHTPGLRLAMWG
jgi:hypothetical protein